MYRGSRSNGKASRSQMECLANDAKAMEEIRDLLASRRKFPLEDEVGGKRNLRSYLEGQPLPDTDGTEASTAALEAIVLSVGRPSLLIREGRFEEPHLQIWKERLAGTRPNVEKMIPSVGRVELLQHPDFKWVGTGWVVDEGVVVTNRHVAETFAARNGNGLAFRSSFLGQISARVDFLEEYQEPEEFEVNIQEILFLAERGRADIALLRLKGGNGLPDPIPLSERDPEDRLAIGVIGYPASDGRRNPGPAMGRIFRDIYDVKRFAPGFVTLSDSSQVIEHDCTTLGGNSGSPLIDLASGEAVGLHFSGRFGSANFAVKAGVVRDRLARHGVVSCAGAGTGEEERRRPEDYADRQGYDEDFLGNEPEVTVPLPRLSNGLRRNAVRVGRQRGMSGYALDYTHFSVVMNGSRKLAYYTAVNIDGSEEILLRRRNTTWKIDPRIPRDVQAGNELYRGNRLDRGHLVRRLDPVWGSDSVARRADDDTFHYSNAAPQHERLNQRSWLALEEYLLRNAHARDLKISVFTGSVFSEDDPRYRRDFRLPQEYWKVVAMVTPQGNLNATAYLLSQKRLLDEIEFAFGAFRTYQVAVGEIEEITGIDFGGLKASDPLESVESTGAREIRGPEDLLF